MTERILFQNSFECHNFGIELKSNRVAAESEVILGPLELGH